MKNVIAITGSIAIGYLMASFIEESLLVSVWYIMSLMCAFGVALISSIAYFKV